MTPAEIRACLAEVTRLTSAPARSMEHPLDGMLQQAGLSRPPEASQLLGVLLPRQEVRS